MTNITDPKTFADYVIKTAHKRLLIAVIGGGECSEEVYAAAEETGKEIAVRGGIIVCGGLYGVMEACCKGAKSVAGVTIGILPGTDIGSANDYVDIPVATGQGISRNAIIAHTGRAAIAIDGKYGTLSEIGFFLQLNKPVVGLGSWDIQGVMSVEKPVQAVEKIFKLLL